MRLGMACTAMSAEVVGRIVVRDFYLNLVTDGSRQPLSDPNSPTSFLGAEVFFSLLSLFLPLVFPSLDVFSLAGSFRRLFLLFVLSARFMLLGSFLREFIFC
jgi:hypothetical protein